jgi:hypothetical protein
MATELFAVNSRDEAARFEQLLVKYSTAQTQSQIKHIPLTEAYDCLQSRPDGGLIFATLLDVQTSFLMLYLDFQGIGTTWEGVSQNSKLKGGTNLDSEAKFFRKMEIHRLNTAYVLRYRALWEKLMGLMILIYAPNEYESFLNAKSKKAKFQKLAAKHQFVEAQFLEKLDELFTRFDSKFPNLETNDAGARRKHSFIRDPLDNNPQSELIAYWNAVNGFVSKFGKIISKAPKA